MRTQALFEEGYMAGALAGTGMYILMIKVNGVRMVNDSSISRIIYQKMKSGWRAIGLQFRF
ncbi:MAG: hypothetical protein ACMUIM_10685 [bacterium]